MSKMSKFPEISKLRKEDYLTLFENAIVDKYGFEYNSDSANISWRDLDVIQKEIKQTPYKFYYARGAYQHILQELKEYVTQNYDLEGVELCEEDLEAILRNYNDGFDPDHSITKQLETIEKVLDEDKEI